jgi:H+/Cl- antiporter ClcA
MEIFIMMGACICSVLVAAIATFFTWVVCKIRKQAAKPNYARVFFSVLIGVFVAYLALVAITDNGHSIPK